MPRKKSAKKYQLTINNPADKGYSHSKIIEILNIFNYKYWCLCDEIGNDTGTYHTHIFLITNNSVMFETIQNRFYGAHIEQAYGTNEENYNYIRKIGDKFEDKKETNLPDTFKESGDLPPDRNSKNSTDEDIVELIKQGCTNAEIIEQIPKAIGKIDKLDKIRETFNYDKLKNKIRQLEVTYLWGKAGCGKTSFVLQKYGVDKVFRVTNYKNPFDNYNGQKIVLFEEFRSSLPIEDMLTYLDIYPCNLPCRYADKFAQYETVYICTNIPIEKQYVETQHTEPETYRAFRRRVHKVIEIKYNKTIEHNDFTEFTEV